MPDFSKDTSDDAKTVWEQRYRSDDIPWEKGYAAPPLAEILSKQKLTGRVLVPGCGFGHDVRLLAQAGTVPLGLDISPYAIDKAKSYNQVAKEKYEVGDFFSLHESGCSKFDWIFEHTFLCAIDPTLRGDYVHSAFRLLKDNGHLAAVFFIHIEDPEGPPYPISSEEVDQLFHPKFDTLEQWVPKSAYPGREGREEVRIIRRKTLQLE